MVVGYTQGTFDIFHRGHLNLLRHAKEKCDKLIVGVNSDRLVREYKKKSTVYSEDDRMEIIRSLGFVDEVVLCDSLDKMEKWKKYKFDKVFIGDDWKGNARWETTKKDLARVGVEVVFLPHTEGISSSMIREKLNLGNRIVDVSCVFPLNKDCGLNTIIMVIYEYLRKEKITHTKFQCVLGNKNNCIKTQVGERNNKNNKIFKNKKNERKRFA